MRRNTLSNLNEAQTKAEEAIKNLCTTVNVAADQMALNVKLMESGILLTEIIPLIAMFAVERHSIPEAADTLAINKLAGLHPFKTYKELYEMAENFLNIAQRIKAMQTIQKANP